ncbi:unnamed protein product [Cylindrotheca closterium]|uniref:DUF6824 domain-containing protein n=1 Tax=Cylindrotheca closterium TaxID=2856 RepID=A0AAD2GCJ0_9STRA|nr:unnamed protein product [Cylindrotheca closterium]
MDQTRSPSSCMSKCNLLGASKQYSNSRQEMEDTEGILTSELNKLSLQERAKALEDIHCVGQDLEETPELVEELLAEFDRTAQQQEQHDPSYKEMAKRHRAYVQDRSLRLKFIRSKKHDVGKAVNQMLHFLRNKAKYFGNDCIGREISFDDMNEEDQELLLSGFYNIGKDRDQSGRVVMYVLPELTGSASPETFCRVAYYVYFNILVSFPEVQMKGFVFVFYDISKDDQLPSMPSIDLSLASIDMIMSIPIRFSATHYCLKARTEKLGVFNSVFKLIFKTSGDTQSYSKVRSRMHYGSDIELLYQLRGHGINTDSAPVTNDGTLREENRNDWLFDHLEKERSDIIERNQSVQESSSVEPNVQAAVASVGLLASGSETIAVDDDAEELISIVAHDGSSLPVAPGTAVAAENQHGSGKRVEKAPITPTDADILLGRGRLVQYNPGNIRFRELAAKYKDAYDTAPGRRRKEVVVEVESILRSEGRRFLKQVDTDVWVKGSEKEIKTKVAQLFREFRKTK